MSQQSHNKAAIFVATTVGLAYGTGQSITAGILEGF